MSDALDKIEAKLAQAEDDFTAGGAFGDLIPLLVNVARAAQEFTKHETNHCDCLNLDDCAYRRIEGGNEMLAALAAVDRYAQEQLP